MNYATIKTAAAYAALVIYADKATVVHSVAVAAGVDGDHAVAAALLHDIVEDGFIAAADLVNYVGDDVAATVGILTRKDGMTYTDYIMAIVASGDMAAVAVKKADLMVNAARCDADYKATGTKPTLAKRYAKAAAILAA